MVGRELVGGLGSLALFEILSSTSLHSSCRVISDIVASEDNYVKKLVGGSREDSEVLHSMRSLC